MSVPRLGLRVAPGVLTRCSRAADPAARRPRPLVVLCAWMGARPQQMSKYLDLWSERGSDTLSFAVGPQHVLFPALAQRHMEGIASQVRAELDDGDGDRPVIFHHFSVGGFLFGQMLRTLEAAGAVPAPGPWRGSDVALAPLLARPLSPARPRAEIDEHAATPYRCPPPRPCPRTRSLSHPRAPVSSPVLNFGMY